MAQLPPDGEYLIQMVSDERVVLLHRWSEKTLCEFDPGNPDDMFPALARLFTDSSSPLTMEQRTLAFFWAGYFYAHTGKEGGV